MQSKGAIRFVAIVLLLASIWQLSFTAVNKYYDSKAEKEAKDATLKRVEAEVAKRDHVLDSIATIEKQNYINVLSKVGNSASLTEEEMVHFSEMAEIDSIAAIKAKKVVDSLSRVRYSHLLDENKVLYIDSLARIEKQKFIDSLSRDGVYFGYTLKDVMSKSINLGLDLKGGMNVMLQVQLKDLVQALAGNKSKTPELQQALALAQERSKNSSDDFITLFEEAWGEVAGGKKLAEVFANSTMKDKVKASSSNSDVISVLRSESESAIANSFNVLRNRIDRFGVTQPNIQKLGNNGRILVELPGVKEPERVRKLLQGTASLEFWETYHNGEVSSYLTKANEVLAENLTVQNADSLSSNAYGPLFSILQPSVAREGACVGVAHFADTAKINEYLRMKEVKAVLPRELKLLWTVKPQAKTENIFELVAIKVTSRDGKAKIDGGVVTDATVQFSNTGGSPEVSMTMDAKGARDWATITKNNVGRQIAIVLDGMVYSYPVVNGEIPGGRSQITGDFTIEEAEDLANVLKSGKLPAPATIIQEQVVGPSLGAESINAGLISFIIAFVLVLLYMIIFYNGAGIVADIALLCNVVLLFGTLVSFGAVLTLPGIAGLVLTLGMAVDANVIIYERVKEELRAGKGLSKAVADGYRNAYSAIIDGQITTLLTGIVLYRFGSGPVQGFATTLIIGIVTSVITSIFITRILIDDRVSKGKNVTFDNKFTRNFLQNTHVDFIGKRKIAYIVSALLIVGSIVSMSTKGFTYGVDFTGGRTYVVRFNQPVNTEDVRKAIGDAFELAVANDSTVTNSSAEVKQFGGASQIKITTTYKIDTDMNADSTLVDDEVTKILYGALKDFYTIKENGVVKDSLTYDGFTSTQTNPNGIISSDKVGPTIADDITRSSLIAVLIALLVIFGYIAIRFRGWTWGLGGVLGLAHTAVIVIGFFSVFSGILPFSLDIDQTFIAAILTIIGYAINDTVVIFDRIREFKGLHPKADFKTNVNAALNSTLSRTMNTSLTTLITMVAIAIFGGEMIRGLAVALIIGIVIGTYASIFIATPIMYDVTKKSPKKADK